MKSQNKKQKECESLVHAIMFVLLFVFLAHLAISLGQTGVPLFSNNQWIMDENSQYYDTDGEFPLAEENYVSHANSSEVDGMLAVDDKNLQTTQESSLLLEQGSNEVHDSKVWKIVLVTAVLLVSVVGFLGTAYYLCVWRGGRIHYQPQKTYA